MIAVGRQKKRIHPIVRYNCAVCYPIARKKEKKDPIQERSFLHNDPARIPESQVMMAIVEWTTIQVNIVFCFGIKFPKISP